MTTPSPDPKWRESAIEPNESGTMWIAVAESDIESALFEAPTIEAARRHRSEFLRRESAVTTPSPDREETL